MQDIEELVTTGKELEACPYYGTRRAIPSAQVEWWIDTVDLCEVLMLMTLYQTDGVAVNIFTTPRHVCTVCMCMPVISLVPRPTTKDAL